MKKPLIILPLILLLSFMVGCTCNTDCKSLKAQAELEEKNLELVRQMWTEWNNRNIEFFMEVHDSAEYVFISPINNPNPMSHKEFIEDQKKYWEVMPDVTINVEELMATGDKVITTFIWKGTHSKEYFGIPATGNKIETSSINIVRIKDGKIIEERENFDELSEFKQLGMELKLKE